MKWIIWLIVIIVILFGGWYLLSQPSSTTNQPTSTATTTVPADIVTGVSNTGYSNSTLDFSILYPSTASTTGTFSSGYLPVTQTPIVAFTLPQSMYQGTNLTEAGVYIGATSTPSIVASCTEASQQNDETAAGSSSIGGTAFSVFTSTGVGAGNIYQEKTYRTVRNGSCLEITELLHSGNIDNYPTGSTQQFDQNEFSGILDAIVQTYQPTT